MIAIIDYGMGNLRSVQKGMEKVGLDAVVTSEKKVIDDARGVVLPGVGAAKDCMTNLKEQGLVDTVIKSIDSGKPFLGICLGLQVLFTGGDEFGSWEGLDVFKGRVVRFSEDMEDPEAGPDAPALKVPHMGWNQIRKNKETPALDGIDEGAFFYFVHSYHVVPEDTGIIATITDYGIEFVSSVAKDNLFASQFHPEKSQRLGLQVLDNFGRMVNES